jgi:hypothetical protein
MLKYLLDENISHVVAERLAERHPHIFVASVYRWRNGGFVGEPDARILQAARGDGLTLVTYDVSTISVLLAELAAEGDDHAGVVFVADASIRSDDFGGLVRALDRNWQRLNDVDWTNRMAYLEPAR